MYETTITYTNLMEAMCTEKTVEEENLVKKAFHFAETMHKNQFRKMGEPYIMHPLRVAKLLAKWGFDYEMVAAALLHDVMEDCNVSKQQLENNFGVEIADIVDTLTEVNEQLYKGLAKDKIDKFSNVHFMETITQKALFIKAADRIDNLHTISCMSEEKQFKKAQHTREILLPLIIKQGAYRLVDLLEELCFKIEHKKRYCQISETYQQMRNKSHEETHKSLVVLEETLSNVKNNMESYDTVFRHDIVLFMSTPRSNISVFREATRNTNNINKELDKSLQKQNIAQYDLTLVLSDEPVQLEVFFTFYQKLLVGAGFSVLGIYETTHKDSKFLLFEDSSKNKFRLFIRTDKTYKKYCLGRGVDNENTLKPDVINKIEPRDSYKTKIKVYKRNGETALIDEGATVLDMAFLIHTEVGMHFAYAMIDESKAQMPAHTRLNEGDMITIATNEEVTAKIKWFNYIKTSRATHQLVKYFTDKYVGK